MLLHHYTGAVVTSCLSVNTSTADAATCWGSKHICLTGRSLWVQNPPPGRGLPCLSLPCAAVSQDQELPQHITSSSSPNDATPPSSGEHLLLSQLHVYTCTLFGCRAKTGVVVPHNFICICYQQCLRIAGLHCYDGVWWCSQKTCLFAVNVSLTWTD